MIGLWIALCMTVLAAGAYAAGWHGRGWMLEHREGVVRFERRAADHDKQAAQAIRAQAEDMLIDAEWQAIAARALTTATQPLPTIRIRVGGGWAGLREWSRATFGADDHEGWEGDHAADLSEVRREFTSRAKWPLRTRKPVTPLAMPQHLPPSTGLAVRVHTLGRTA